MSNKEFLKRMKEAGEKYSGSAGQGIIGRVLVEFGLHRYVADHEFWSFWKPVSDEKEMDIIAAELKARLQKAGSNDNPSFGVKITIKKDVLSRDEPYKADLMEFIPVWQKDSFDLICDAIEKADIELGKIFYGHVQYKANPFFVKQGEAGKKDTDQDGIPRYPSIRVPVGKFANEAEAKAAAVGSGAGGSANINSDSSYSNMIHSGIYPTIADFELQFESIQKYYNLMSDGKLPYEGAPALPQPLIPPKIKEYLADMYTCEITDIDLALEEVPF